MKKRSPPPGSNIRIKSAGNHAADWDRIAKKVLRAPPPGIPCGDRTNRYHVRDLVRHSDLEPECAEYWAIIYDKAAYIDPTEVGGKMLKEARWDLTFAMLWIACNGASSTVVSDYNAFVVIWHDGIWNGPMRAAYIMWRQSAKEILWKALRNGEVRAYANVEDKLVPIEALAWDTLEFLNAGPAQIVGHKRSQAAYVGVKVEAQDIKKLTPVDTRTDTYTKKEKRKGRPANSSPFILRDRKLVAEAEALISNGLSVKEALYKVAQRASGSGPDAAYERLRKLRSQEKRLGKEVIA